MCGLSAVVPQSGVIRSENLVDVAPVQPHEDGLLKKGSPQIDGPWN